MVRRNETKPYVGPAQKRSKIAAQRTAKLLHELDKIMPRLKIFGYDLYSCNECGSLVKNRVIHLRWHEEKDKIFDRQMRLKKLHETVQCLWGE